LQQLDSGAFSNLKSAWCEDMRIFTQLQLVVRVEKETFSEFSNNLGRMPLQ